MGNSREYQKSGGFSQYLYIQIGETITASNGVQGKIVKEIDNNSDHYSLPTHSNSSEVYLKQVDESGQIEQARVYVNRLARLDFDWGHSHGKFKEGTVHVQSWRMNKNGKWIRDSKSARFMNNCEMKRYGELLKLADPKVKLRSGRRRLRKLK